ncbi:MAG: hypothetical protein ABSG86_27745 [Thermoguttaceae bacterium]
MNDSRAWVMLPGLGADERKMCVAMFRDADPHFMRWAVGAILRWRPAPLEGIPVRAIHGARDRLIPACRVEADEIVPGGGHLINLTHADAVNRFLREAGEALP